MNMNMTQIPQNYKNNVDWVLGAYSDAGVSFPNGFQKDAIQNSVGARKGNSWRNWKCDISYLKNEHGEFIIVEDSGTVGLTGKNTSADEINRIMNRGEKLRPTERLSLFTSMFNSSGSESTGPGLYGAGKSVFSVASKKYTYYFDSLRGDNTYVANVNASGRVYSVAFEGAEAVDFICRHTGLSEKTSTGTRIIIESPKEDLIGAINDGTIISFIQESWWRVIQRLPESACISVNSIPISVPENIFKNAKHTYELPKPENYTPGYRVKNFGLYVYEDNAEQWAGISYYRRGMKIGDIEINDVPKELNGKYWGYIEVDEEWEAELSEIEDKVHFGVSKGKKRALAYQYLKNYCNAKVNENLIKWGYIKDRESDDKKLKDELMEIANDIQDLFDRLGFEDLGKGPRKEDFDVRWQNVVYPDRNSERVTEKDLISFSFRIKSSYPSEKNFDYNLFVINHDTNAVVSQIAKNTAAIEPASEFSESFSFAVNKNNSAQYAENRIVLSVKAVDSGKEKRKELPYFFDVDKPDSLSEPVSLVLHECTFPIPGSRRVNFGESIRNVCYGIENRRNRTLDYRLNISTHNASDPACPKIKDISSFSGTVLPFEEGFTPQIDQIVFDSQTYGQYLSEGTIELRARLIANKDDGQFEKGDKITGYNLKLYLNTDEKSGKKDSFDVKSVDDPDDCRRSWCISGPSRTIVLNIGHPAYSNLADYPEVQHEYKREQMLKQYVLLYLSEGKYEMFNSEEEVFSKLDPEEAAERVLSIIEDVYFQSLK